jgi:hypothetical protein
MAGSRFRGATALMSRLGSWRALLLNKSGKLKRKVVMLIRYRVWLVQCRLNSPKSDRKIK